MNEGEATAPSKRILAAMPGFDKVDHGVAAAEAIGLQALRAKCPRFDEWITTLEALGAHAVMTLTITEAFDLPRPEDIRAMGFVVKLREAEPDSDEVKQLVDDYVITPAVEKELPRILDDMKQVFDRGEEYGRFIHGSFGSGKSHFMTMLSLLLEGDAAGLEEVPAAIQRPSGCAAGQGSGLADHESWLAKAGLLVVESTCSRCAARTRVSTALSTTASTPR